MISNNQSTLNLETAVLTDYISLDYLQKLQDGISEATGNNMVILDTEGSPITKDTQIPDEFFHGEGRYMGIRYDGNIKLRLMDAVKRIGKEMYIVSSQVGLVAAAVPIYINKQLLGVWIVRDKAEHTDQKEVYSNIDPKLIAEEQIYLKEEEADFKAIVNLINLVVMELITLINSKIVTHRQNFELREASRKLTSSLSLMKDFVNISDVGMYMVYLDTGEVIMANNLYSDQFGMDSEQVVGYKCFELMGFKERCSFCRALELVDEDGNIKPPIVWENYLEMLDRWLRITSKNIRWVDGRIAHMVTYLDITESKKHHKEMEYLALYDRRLNIPNAAKLHRDIQTVDVLKSHLLVYDIKGLRHLNEVYDHEVGDALLDAVMKWVISEKGIGTQIYRIDGDSFGVLYENVTLGYVYERAIQLSERFQMSWRLGEGQMEKKIYTHVSIGVIPVEKGVNSYFDLMNLIERVLISAKVAVKPVIYDEELDARFRKNVRLEGSLKTSVLNGMIGFYLCYQPIVDPETKIWVGLEGLCRWISPELGFVPPDEFISQAEQMGLIGQIGEWVLEEAVKQVKKWGLDEYPEFVLDVNLSPIQLNEENLAEVVTEILQRYNYPPEKLSLEVTEGVEVHFHDTYVKEILSKLIETGVHIAMDDFGIGYASFSNLNNLPFSTLKTDRSFMQNIENDKFLQHTVKVMAEFAHLADMHMIAEGVESEIQSQMVAAAGADLIQGYYYAKPLNVEEIDQKLEKFKGVPKIHRLRKP